MRAPLGQETRLATWPGALLPLASKVAQKKIAHLNVMTSTTTLNRALALILHTNLVPEWTPKEKRAGEAGT